MSVSRALADAFVPTPIQEKFRDPSFLRAFHGWATWFWIIMAPISAFTGLKESIAYLVMLSVYAVVTGHWSSWQASRAEIGIREVGDDDASS
jgi:hypothetical protein